MRSDRLSPYLFVLPALALFLTFRLYPLVSGAFYSLTDWDGIAPARFIGLANFVEIANDPAFRSTMRNVLVVVATLPIWAGLPLILAILIHLGVPGAGFYRAAYFFPIVLSSIIIGTMFNIILRFDGSFNQFLALFGIPAVDWLGDRRFALTSVVCVAIWAHFGMNVLIYLSGLATVPSDVVEAARVDGATLRQVVFRIIIPLLRPTLEFVAVISTITILTSMFGLIYVMTAGGPGTATYMPEFLIWLMQGEFNRLGYASAISVVLFLVVAVLGFAP
ncbi:MAG: sugar ABC transporter permease, partial [Acetobacteraceae bacterium]|nr:sugar ABC transporter permease [Acetobacteraceae bacterium]